MASANQGGSPSPTSPRRIAAAERQAQALELRKAGYTLVQIAEKLGYASDAGVRKAIRTALEKTIKQPADEVRLLLLARNEAYIKAIYAKAVAGDLDAIDRCVKIDRQTAALHGLSEMKLKVGGDADAPPIQVAVDANLRHEIYSRLSTDELRVIRDLRNRLVESAGGGGGGEEVAAVERNGAGPDPG
jgi:hypothetical protein